MLRVSMPSASLPNTTRTTPSCLFPQAGVDPKRRLVASVACDGAKIEEEAILFPLLLLLEVDAFQAPWSGTSFLLVRVSLLACLFPSCCPSCLKERSFVEIAAFEHKKKERKTNGADGGGSSSCGLSCAYIRRRPCSRSGRGARSCEVYLIIRSLYISTNIIVQQSRGEGDHWGE